MRLPLAALVLAGAGACFDLNGPPPANEPHFLERACSAAACVTTGDAQRTTGLTADTLGFRAGPGKGAIVVTVQSDGEGIDLFGTSSAEVSGSYNVRLLVAGHGSIKVRYDLGQDVSSGATVLGLPSSYNWVDFTGQFASPGVENGHALIKLVIEVDDGSQVDLADVEAQGVDYVGACSVAHVGRR